MNLYRKFFFNILYLTNPPWDTGITPPELVSFINSHPPGRALDLGCGTGTNAVFMAQHGWQVTGVDFISRAIRSARRKSDQAGVKVDFFLDDVARLRKVKGLFDLVLDIGCFHSLQEKEKKTYIQNLERILRPGGTFLMYTFIKSRPDQKRGISKSDLETLQRFLHLDSRQDGTERGLHDSTWLQFRK